MDSLGQELESSHRKLQKTLNHFRSLTNPDPKTYFNICPFWYYLEGWDQGIELILRVNLISTWVLTKILTPKTPLQISEFFCTN